MMTTISAEELTQRIGEDNDFSCFPEEAKNVDGLSCEDCIFNKESSCGGHSYDAHWEDMKKKVENLPLDTPVTIDMVMEFLRTPEGYVKEHTT